ncbi:MAG: Unknown protein [uncultured Aureispira sp.]|uniref:Uncharacterized protein n=1 Tax=uncultured Aureispira sp. TaxID=1331704 RepID=A0A6S6U3E5_9BACT|nr:MAG: Unknown protein [uncultured Aureispira sp.]
MKDFNIVEVAQILNKMELELKKYSRLFAEDGNITASEQKVLDMLKLKLAKVKASTEKNINAKAFSKEDLGDLPKALLDFINKNIPDKDKAREIIEVVKKIYDSNIKDQEYEVKRKVATQALKNTLEAKKENFTHADFHAEYEKLFRNGLIIGTEVDVNEVDIKDVDPGVNGPKTKIKLLKGGVFKKKLGDYFTLKGEVVIDHKVGDNALLKMKGDILDNEVVLKLFKNEFDLLATKTSTTLLELGSEVENIAGYEWLTFTLKADVGSIEADLPSMDLSLSMVKITGTFSGSPTKKFLSSLSPSLGELSDVLSVAVNGKLEFNIKASKDDVKWISKISKLSEGLADKIEELPDLIKEAKENQSKARRARKDFEKAKTQGVKAAKAAKQEAVVADKLYQKTRRKVIKYGKDINKRVKNINAASTKISKAGKPVAKAVKSFFGKRAARVLMKFIPGLNIISTALDVYDIVTVVAPVVIKFIGDFWEEMNQLPDPIDVDDRVRDFFEFIGQEDKLGHMTQSLADKYKIFFKSFNEIGYDDFKTKLAKLQGTVVYKSVEDYLDALIEKKAYFAEQMGSDDNMIKQKIRADYVADSAIINEGAQIITVKKEISFPHSNNEAVTPVQLFQYQITNNK